MSMLHYCANMKAISYESTSLNRIAADKSHRVIVAIVTRSELYDLKLYICEPTNPEDGSKHSVDISRYTLNHCYNIMAISNKFLQ